jgi:EAL domain-containing protein (putative c-di-GMP-specific phosphodiesterase class I)
VRASLTLPYVVSSRELTLGATVGLVPSGRGYSQAEAMLRDAEAALNRAKCRGKGCVEVFSPSMYDVSLRRLDLEGELKNAVRRGELLYHYQPIVEMRTGQIRSSEALIRWHHPHRGLLPPSQFIEAIEEGGLLPIVGWSLLPEALSQLRRWRNRVGFGSDFAMNLNLTGQQLLQPEVVESFLIELARHQLPPSALRIEVTENTLISGQAELIEALNRLADIGVEIQLDDFGTGFASLRHLSELPLSAVKIDRSFVTPLLKGRKEASIVESLIAMAHGLGLKVIAEGVENTDQFDLLGSLGCDYAQGFLIGKPMPFDQFDEGFAQSVRPWTGAVEDGSKRRQSTEMFHSAHTLPFVA